jgi:hypothetical protein
LFFSQFAEQVTGDQFFIQVSGHISKSSFFPKAVFYRAATGLPQPVGFGLFRYR